MAISGEIVVEVIQVNCFRGLLIFWPQEIKLLKDPVQKVVVLAFRIAG
jgi:hypothetical protein